MTGHRQPWYLDRLRAEAIDLLHFVGYRGDPDELAAKFVGNSHFETQGKEPEAEAETKA